MTDLRCVSAEDLNYSLLGSSGMLYLFQGLSNSIFGYELKWWNVTVFWFLVKIRSFIIQDSCRQRQWYLMPAVTKCDFWLPVSLPYLPSRSLHEHLSQRWEEMCLVGVGRKPPKSSSMMLVMRCSLAVCMFSYTYSIWKERECFVKLWRIMTFRPVPEELLAIMKQSKESRITPSRTLRCS